MKMFRMLGAFLLTMALVIVADSAPGGNDKKKNDKKGAANVAADVVGVIVEVHADKNVKDKELGTIVVRTPAKTEVKITVLKSTDITHNGKKVDFKALDKGDQVTVDLMKSSKNADKILIRKN